MQFSIKFLVLLMFSLSITTFAFPTSGSDSSLIARADASTSASTSTSTRPYYLVEEEDECPEVLRYGDQRWTLRVTETEATRSVEQLRDAILRMLHRRYPSQQAVISAHIIASSHEITICTPESAGITKETLKQILGL